MERRKGKCSQQRNHQVWKFEKEAACDFPGTARRPAWFKCRKTRAWNEMRPER